MLDIEKVTHLTQRLGSASYRTLPGMCTHIVNYVKQNISPQNRVFLRFEQDRKDKWTAWSAALQPGGRWTLPETTEDCASLAWHLVSELSTLGDQSISLLFSMYRRQHFDDNIYPFLKEWQGFIDDAMQSLADADAPKFDDHREKQQKFGILDSPTLYESDARKAIGVFGRAAIYIDLDNFKLINTRFTEVTVDQNLLPIIHQLLRECVQHIGYAYAEGGDEFVMLLPNASKDIALAVAESVRRAVQETDIRYLGEAIRITASLGVAHELPGSHNVDLRKNANVAKQFAKDNGRNRVALFREDGCQLASP